MTNTEKRLKLFDENFASEIILEQEVRTVLPGLKLFIAESIQEAVEEERVRLVAMINDQKYTRGDYTPDDGGYMDAYDQALDDLLSSLKEK